MSKMTDYILKHSKKNDKQLKYDFMPSMLEIIEKPAHIGGKVIIYSILSILIGAVIWACLSELDVVVTATGSTKPIGDIKTVQAYSTGTIKEICVSNGQYVNKGDVLMMLDGGIIDIDVNQINSQIAALNVQLDLYQRILDGYDITAISIDEYSQDLKAYALTIIDTEKNYLENLENLSLQKSNYDLDYQITVATKNNYESNIRDLVIQQKELQVQQAELAITNAATQHSGQINNRIAEITQNLNSLNAQLEKSGMEQDNQYITAPVDGYVNRIEINTIGGVGMERLTGLLLISVQVPLHMSS